MHLSALPVADLDELREQIDGRLIQPGDADYDEARQAWNLAADQRPAAVAIPRSILDIQAIVRVARRHGLRVAPQGTGHNGTALTSLEQTILVKTHEMREVRIDPDARIARAEAGAICLDVAGPASEHGLAFLSGSSPDVGVVGFALGGGIGWLARHYGMAADSVLAVELVTADGEHVRADRNTNTELFWALRGGNAGNFGVVTAIELQLFATPDLVAGAMMWPAERSNEILKAWRAWTDTVPETVTTAARVMTFPPIPDVPEPFRGNSFVVIDGAILADEATAAEILQPLRDLEPTMDMFGPMAPVGLSHIHMDPEQPVPAASDSTLLTDVTDEVIDIITDLQGPGSQSPLLFVELRHWGGALGRRRPDAGALGQIDGAFGFFAVGMAMNEDMKHAVERHAAMVRAAVEPWSSGSLYLNFAEAPTDTSKGFSADSYARLRAVKAQVDPDNIIQANHPIAPAA
jgi:FAD/FMN-containing dehydrogenase